jgi:hypothetical protein
LDYGSVAADALDLTVGGIDSGDGNDHPLCLSASVVI